MSLMSRSSSRPRPEFLDRLLRSRNAMIGGLIVGTVLLVALLAPWIMPHNPNKVSVLANFRPPGGDYLLGTDELGRDILSRLILGARVSLGVAFTVLAATMTIGVLAGMCAAWFRGRIDGILMRIVDVIFAFPEVIVAIFVASIMGPGLLTTIVALSLVWWPGIARLSRSLVMGQRNELYIDAAIGAGTPSWRIMWRHILPNILSPLIVRASLGVGMVIMGEAGLSFLGLGVQDPWPSWGGMIRDGLPVLRTDPHLALSASAALGITMIGFNLLGDGLRDVLDPKAKY